MRFGARTTLLPGLALIAAGLALFARVPVDGRYLTDLLPTMVLIGTGVGTAFPALATLAMSGATPEDAGLASGLVNTTMQVGAALGLAVLATLSATRSATLIAHGQHGATALTGGYRLGFLVGAALVAAAIAIAIAVLPPGRRAARGSDAEPTCSEPACVGPARARDRSRGTGEAPWAAQTARRRPRGARGRGPDGGRASARAGVRRARGERLDPGRGASCGATFTASGPRADRAGTGARSRS